MSQRTWTRCVIVVVVCASIIAVEWGFVVNKWKNNDSLRINDGIVRDRFVYIHCPRTDYQDNGFYWLFLSFLFILLDVYLENPKVYSWFKGPWFQELQDYKFEIFMIFKIDLNNL